MEKYRKCDPIGRGRFGSVYQGFNCLTRRSVALKEFRFFGEEEGIPASVLREASFLIEMQHANIVSLLDVVYNETAIYFVLEHMDLDLNRYMKCHKERAKKPHLVKKFMHQILSALVCCHSHKIVHRDVKPQNILVNVGEEILKLADFGSARALDVPLAKYSPGENVATMWYEAPELLLCCNNYSYPVDVWSAGCIFAQMVNQKPLFDGFAEIIHVNKIFSILGTPNEEIWPGITSMCDVLSFFVQEEPKDLASMVPSLEPAGVDLLSKMLCMNPSTRITASDALDHPYFHNL